jgi:hypothetical protein
MIGYNWEIFIRNRTHLTRVVRRLLRHVDDDICKGLYQIQTKKMTLYLF